MRSRSSDVSIAKCERELQSCEDGTTIFAQSEDGNTKENSLLNGGFDQAKATSPKQQDFLHNGSESASSDFSQDVQQHLGGLTQKKQERQVAKQYVIGATKHLVEMCNTYWNEIDGADKDEVMNEVLEAVRGKSPVC